MSSIQQAMQTLNAQWYNALTSQLNLDPTAFQLVQGYLPLGTLSENLWNIFNAIPPLSVANLYNPTQLNLFSQDYAAVINHLIPQGSSNFITAMGDYYSTWNSAKLTLNPIPSTTLAWIQAFTNWANLNLPQAQVTNAISLFTHMMQDPIAVATSMLVSTDYATQNAGIFAYTTTIEQLQTALSNNNPGKSVVMNSATQSSDVSHTWAQAEASGILDWFVGEGNANYQKWSSQITEAGVQINASFSKIVSLSASPLYQPSLDTYLQNFTPWFNSSALNEGYQDSSNNVWQQGDPTWDGTFGPSGNMQRYTGTLIVVDGITIEITSNAGIQTSDQEEFQSAIAAGFWPFFEAEGSGGWTNSTSFDDQGNITVTSSSPEGNPQILGVLVSPISKIFS